MAINMMNKAHKDNQNPNYQKEYDRIFKKKKKKKSKKWNAKSWYNTLARGKYHGENNIQFNCHSLDFCSSSIYRWAQAAGARSTLEALGIPEIPDQSRNRIVKKHKPSKIRRMSSLDILISIQRLARIGVGMATLMFLHEIAQQFNLYGFIQW